MKVYCKDCKWYREPGIKFFRIYISEECLHPNAIYEVDSYLEKRFETMPPKLRNDNNNCKDFESK